MGDWFNYGTFKQQNTMLFKKKRMKEKRKKKEKKEKNEERILKLSAGCGKISKAYY